MAFVRERGAPSGAAARFTFTFDMFYLSSLDRASASDSDYQDCPTTGDCTLLVTEAGDTLRDNRS
jgi:hypothetical protein